MFTKDLKNLEKLTNNEEETGAVSFISPFDNLTWSKLRTRKLFDFHPALEIYVPKEDRRFGYYALSILYDNQIVGRLDPKMHRDKATLEIRALELKHDFRLTKDFKQKLVLTLNDFMKFHNAQTTKIAKSCPKFSVHI